jgi:uncharacterized protein YbjQ (UPF0145 family)
MIITTGPAVDGRQVGEYLGVVSAQAILGINIGKDVLAGLRNITGGRSGAYEGEIAKAVEQVTGELTAAAQNLGADAVISVDFDYESVGTGGMLMVAASGTAVKLG